MATIPELNSEDLWRRVGLDELRQALVRVQGLAAAFENALQTLPPCTACARVALLERIDAAGRDLSGEVTGLSVLASTLKQAVAAAEQTQTELAANALAPCRCSSGECTCHD
ncbi:MAG: hypothetical protein HY737_05620 [Candidatus Omnitrophica bacterium]|nr:hypothetical protein [Candidatus Omnitrophota bacterium]